MSFLSKARRAVAGFGVVLTLAACGADQALAPADLADPDALIAELAAADAAFDSDAFRSFSAVSLELSASPQLSVAPLAGSLVAATLPTPFGSTTRVLSGATAERFRRLVGQVVSPAAIFPPEAYGTTWEWDETDDVYRVGIRTDGPANGMRFILYRVNDAGTIIEPREELGYADLLDESTDNTDKLHVQVFGTGQTQPYLDYSATVAASSTSLSATVTGTIRNLSPVDERILAFGVGLSASTTRATISATFTLNNPAITFSLTESVSVSGDALVITVDFRVTRDGEVVRIVGRVELTDVIEVSISVRVDDGIVARLSGDPTTAVWQDAGGDPLHPSAYAALEALWDGFAAFHSLVSSALDPVANLTAN